MFSAVGLLLAERAVTVAAACPGRLDDLPADAADRTYADLRRQAERLLALEPGAAACSRQVEMRYVGQAFELTVDLGAERFAEASRSELRTRLDAEHRRRFGHAFDESEPVEIVALKLKAADPSHNTPAALSIALNPSTEEVFRDVWFGDAHGLVRTPVIGRGDLGTRPRRGPMIVEEYEGTTVVPPDASAHRDALDNIVVDLEY